MCRPFHPPFKLSQIQRFVSDGECPSFAFDRIEPCNNALLSPVDRLIVTDQRNHYGTARRKCISLDGENQIRLMIGQLLSEDHFAFLVGSLSLIKH